MIRFLLGEKKEVGIKVVSTRELPFIIAAASYDLINNATGEVDGNGAATIEGTELRALIQPTQRGTYRLVFSYEVSQEELKAPVDIEVK